MLAFDANLVDFAADKLVRDLPVREFTDDDAAAIFLGHAFETRGEVYVVAHHGPGEALVGAHVADVDGPGVEPDADGNCAAAFGFPLGIEFVESAKHLEGAGAGAVGVIGLRVWRSPERHDGIANVFVERTEVSEQHIGHGAEILIKEQDKLIGR